jgi:hypothetical protein
MSRKRNKRKPAKRTYLQVPKKGPKLMKKEDRMNSIERIPSEIYRKREN